ncbi:efflux RND transporter periplasmic adaptor subunit [Pedobacter ginsengisoli]|uniref:efflux RND transporter periplasmic adaptor subunit n=1 Tax=Pedobacter ginsengisoli TaxID=363852 RepID=UPI00254C6DD4|nr:efflux RND transporter periplasmic adaptor subunit [Pedobacter ginsengisoli]
MKSIYKVISLICLGTVLVSCGQDTQKKVTEEEKKEEAHEQHDDGVELTEKQFQVANIELGMVQMKSLSGTVKVNGVLDLPPQSLVSISAPFEGTVKSTEMLQGMKVKKGQPVVVLQHPDYIQVQQDYLDYKSQLEFLRLEYERQQELAADLVNAKKTLQRAKSEYVSMQARVAGLRSRLGLMNIDMAALEKGKLQSTLTLYSPISGYVTQVNTNIGAYANPSDVLFKIANTDHLHAELTVYERDVPKLKIGQKVRFTLANETRERMATIYLVGREISNERTVQVHCHLDQEDGQLLPGMYLQALVEGGSKLVAALPEKAIVEFEGQKYIFVQEGQLHFEMLKVGTGVAELGFVAVELPENFDRENKKVVVNGAYDLLSKAKNSEEGEGHGH